MLFGRNYQRYIVNVTTKEIHCGLGREIIDFEESLSETRWGVKKYESHYMSEEIINVTKRTPWGFERGFVKQPVRSI